VFQPLLGASGRFGIGLTFKLKGKSGWYGPISNDCIPSGARLICHVEGDGGRFTLAPNGEASMMLRVEELRVEGESDLSPEFRRGDSDSVFVLRRMNETRCPRE
jgi:hypothetical protein